MKAEKMSVSRETLLNFFEVDLGIDTAEIEDETKLVSAGIVDSFSLVSLMTFIESEGGFRISPAEVTFDNLDTISRILQFSARRAEAAES